jgi:type VI secretion system protein ImpH
MTDQRSGGGGVIDRLRTDPHRFTFQQAVRLWQREGLRTGTGRPVGHDHPPAQTAVRLTAHQALGFQPGQVAPRRHRDDEEDGPPHVSATFLGMTGPNGALPQHYTETVMQRSRERDTALREFLDTFNHRLLSLFWRAAAKYRLDQSYELVEEGATDPITQSLLALVGLGLPGLRDRLPVPDECIIHYGGHFSHRPPSAVALEGMLSAMVGRPVQLVQFHGRWLTLPPEEQTRLGAPEGCRLGLDTVAGDRVWDVQGSLRLRIGPLTWAQFRQFQPDGDELRRLAAVTRLYVGPEFAFDVQVVLARQEVPRPRMPSAGGDADADEGPRLGWNTWLVHDPPRQDAEEAVFMIRDL